MHPEYPEYLECTEPVRPERKHSWPSLSMPPRWVLLNLTMSLGNRAYHKGKETGSKQSFPFYFSSHLCSAYLFQPFLSGFQTPKSQIVGIPEYSGLINTETNKHRIALGEVTVLYWQNTTGWALMTWRGPKTIRHSASWLGFRKSYSFASFHSMIGGFFTRLFWRHFFRSCWLWRYKSATTHSIRSSIIWLLGTQ